MQVARAIRPLQRKQRASRRKKQTKSNAPYHHEFVVEVGNLRVGYKIDHDVVARTCQRIITAVECRTIKHYNTRRTERRCLWNINGLWMKQLVKRKRGFGNQSSLPAFVETRRQDVSRIPACYLELLLRRITTQHRFTYDTSQTLGAIQFLRIQIKSSACNRAQTRTHLSSHRYIYSSSTNRSLNIFIPTPKKARSTNASVIHTALNVYRCLRVAMFTRARRDRFRTFSTAHEYLRITVVNFTTAACHVFYQGRYVPTPTKAEERMGTQKGTEGRI